MGGILLAGGREGEAVAAFVFAAVRAALGVVALLIASRALERRDPRDDHPSVF